jgi:predicted kinase
MDRRKVVFFVGTAGSGKSYIAKQLAALVGADYIASGDIARSLPGAYNDLAAGNLYHDDTPILSGTFDFMTNPKRGACVIIDGVPRNENQVNWLAGLDMTAYDWVIVYVDAAVQTRIKRILARARDVHDNHETVVTRVEKDLLGMSKVYGLCVEKFGINKVLVLASEKDGDVTTEVATIMDKLHAL